MCTKDDIYYLSLIADQINGLNESIKEYIHYLLPLLEKECEKEEQLEKHYRKIPF